LPRKSSKGEVEMAMNIKKNDTVKVISGRERGKTGRVYRVMAGEGKVLVEKLNLIKRHTRPSQDNRQGGIIEKEAPINISNVMLICGKCNKPTRVGHSFEGDKKVRVCKKCGSPMDKA
jgi:large subunit ribosomal protein L24